MPSKVMGSLTAVSSMNRKSIQAVAFALGAGALGLVSCGGGGSGGGGGSSPDSRLMRIEFGRLVDIYAYQRVDENKSDRRDTRNRVPVLIDPNVVIGSTIETDALFDAIGGERVDANFRFLPFDVDVGHDRLLILWDNREDGEGERFTSALTRARNSLVEIPASYRDQDTSSRPIPVVPRNAAILLTFSQSLPVGAPFFSANPSAIQLLEFRADPKTSPAQDSFRPLAFRVLPKGNSVIVDTTVIGGEAEAGRTSAGLPTSADNRTANIRLALPVNASRDWQVEPDSIGELNGADSRGGRAVIRDFRSGNAGDGGVGILQDIEAPMVMTDTGMGITAIDREARVLTINKRGSPLAVRARIPFVDGGIDEDTDLPAGPNSVPTEFPLRAGDAVIQVVPDGKGGLTRVRAEILEVLEVGTRIGDLRFKALGLTSTGSDGGELATINVRVASIDVSDGAGNTLSFLANEEPLGKDCTLRTRYYHNVKYSSTSRDPTAVVTDSARINEFMVFEPNTPRVDQNRNPIPRGTKINPTAGVSLRFTEPMDLETVEWANNYVLANDFLRSNGDSTAADLLAEAKPAALSVLVTRLLDADGDGTFLRLLPPIGHYHELGKTEKYRFHMVVGATGPRDLGGNPVDLFDRRLVPVNSFSTSYTLDASKPTNAVGSRLLRFESADEDGSPPGSVDFFGQFQIRGGRMYAAATSRFSRVADAQTLVGDQLNRFDRGECWNPAAEPPATVTPSLGRGALYLTPDMTVTPAPPWQPPMVFFNVGRRTFGGVIEPWNYRGARMQMRYLENDFDLGYRDPSNYLIDLEQMHWSVWTNDPNGVNSIVFDSFDRVTVSAAHSQRRPDIQFVLNVPPMGPPTCDPVCSTFTSHLYPVFEDNVLNGSARVDLVKDRKYEINPNAAFRSKETNTVFLPYQRFERSYTWRDQRLLSWDMATDKAVGLGGADAPNGQPPNLDQTADVDSPWVPSEPADQFPGPTWTGDDGDFLGDERRDLPPITLPLLMDLKVFRSDPSSAGSINHSHIALLGPIWAPPPASPGGYYNQGADPNCMIAWPRTRVWSAGGINNLGNEEYVDPENVTTAKGGWLKDALLGDPQIAQYQHTQPGDDHLHWAQADFVRRVSMVTWGFFDTQKPNQHGLTSGTTGNYPGDWPGVSAPNGLPDFAALGQSQNAAFALTDLVPILDPAPSAQPPGTKLILQFRGAGGFDRSDELYDERDDDTFDGRGNLLNPKYACEAYRYASPNLNGAPRVRANGLTPYVEIDDLDQIRDPVRGTLPRFLNYRLVFENNTAVSPALSPSVRAFGLVYRMTAQ